MKSSLRGEFFFEKNSAQNQNGQLDKFASTHVNDEEYEIKINNDN